MKTSLKYSVLILMLFFSTLAFAEKDKETETSSNYMQEFYYEIQRQLQYPEEAKRNGIDGFVIVSFKIGETGNIEIIEMNSNDVILKHATEHSLSQIKLCSHAARMNREYNMRFNYNLY